MCSTHDFALRALLTDFLRQPEACAGISERWEEDERLEAMMLWHSVVTPNQCSFASMASTEQTIAFLGGAPQCARRDQRRDPIPAVPSFLDLTSSLARLVRGASIPGSPARDVSKTRSESPVGRMGPGPADSSSSGRGFARGETARDGKASAAAASSAASSAATSLAAASATNTTDASRSSAFGFLGFDRLVARASRAARSFGFGSSGARRLYRTKSAEALEPVGVARKGRVERRFEDVDEERVSRELALRDDSADEDSAEANRSRRRGWRMTSWLFSFSKTRKSRGARCGSS